MTTLEYLYIPAQTMATGLPGFTSLNNTVYELSATGQPNGRCRRSSIRLYSSHHAQHHFFFLPRERCFQSSSNLSILCAKNEATAKHIYAFALKFFSVQQTRLPALTSHIPSSLVPVFFYITESWNIPGWKGLIRIIKFNSWFPKGLVQSTKF